MQHLNDEDLIAHHYRDTDASPHLEACADCRAQYATLCGVLALVDSLPVPERDPEQVWNRLRWRLERRRRRTWQWVAGVAAALVLVFLALRPAIRTEKPEMVATTTTQQPNNPTTQQPNNKVLVYVVGDHLDAAERVLAEVANADPKKGLDVAEEQKRAEDLVDANRIYRQTATRRGDARIAALLSDIEPILVELSHSGDKLTPEELTSMQKRIDSKNLLFKMRVMSGSRAAEPGPHVNSL